MEKRTGRCAAELCGAVIGAGFASGKEVAAFFARFGGWSWLGVAAAGAVIAWVCRSIMRSPGEAGMPLAWRGGLMEKLWRGMFLALLVSTGGAMLAGAGETAALLLPVHGAEWIGLAGTLVLGWRLAGRESLWLAVACRGLILCLLGMMLAGLLLPPQEVMTLTQGGPEALIYGLCYGGFNMALAAPTVALTANDLDNRQKARCTVLFSAVVMALLCCGNAVLLRHPSLQASGMPFVRLMSRQGRWGYRLGGGAMYLAALTTLAACLRGARALLSGKEWLAAAAVGACALGGMEAIVSKVYPLLGGGCLTLLILAGRANGTKA